MLPKCKVRKTWPAIVPEGCKAKAEEPWLGYVNDMRRQRLNKKVAELNELVTHTNEIMRVTNIERQNTKNAKMSAATRKKANAAATNAEIIRRIKGARG